MRHRPLIPVCLALMAGIIAGEQLPCAMPMGTVLWVSAAVTAAACCRRCGGGISWGAVLVSTAVGGLALIQPWSHPVFGPDHIVRQVDAVPQTFMGVVSEMPRYGERRLSVFVTVSRRRTSAGSFPVTGRVRVTVGGEPVPIVSAGDHVQFSSTIKPVGGFQNPGGFDYARYMAFQGVWARCWVPVQRFAVTIPAATAAPWWHPDRWRSLIGQWIAHQVAPDAAAVLQSLVIGDRRGLTPRLRTVFNRLGIGHILAISGLHLGIIALVSYRFSRWLLVRCAFLVRRGWADRVAALVTLGPLVAYGMLAGMSPSTQRALAMTLIIMAGALSGRRHDFFNTLAAAALLILCWHPPALFAASFQFSFAAVAAIIAAMPPPAPVPEDVHGLPPPLTPGKRLAAWIRNAFIVSLLANLATAPLAMIHFQQISLVGCLTNLVYIPLFGFLVVPLALSATTMLAILPPLAALLLSAAAGIVTAGLSLAEAAAALPGIAIATVTPNIIELGCYYGVSAWILYDRRRRQAKFAGSGFRRAAGGIGGNGGRRRLVVILLAAVLLLGGDGLYWMHRRFWHRDLRITFLDVGQGSAAVVAFPGGTVMIVDGGGTAMPGAFDVGAGVIAPFLRRERIFTIDIMALTHANSDHLNGLIHIADTFRVGVCWTNGAPADTAGYRRFVETLHRRGIRQLDYGAVYGRHRIGGAAVTVLYPPPGSPPFADQGRRNEDSIVMKVTSEGCSALLTGDITAPAEAALTALHGRKIEADVLQSPHHGSRTSSSPALVAAVSPAAVVISAGWRNRFGFPDPVVLRRYRDAGASVWRIDTGGAVVVSLHDGHWRCRQAGRRRGDGGAAEGVCGAS